MQRILEVSMETDLLPFSAFLWQEGIAHRITEESGCQVLWLENPVSAYQVKQFYADWQMGFLQLDEVKIQWWKWWKRRGLINGPLANWKRIPMTLLFLVICLIVALMTRMGSDYQTIAWFSFLDFDIGGKYIRSVPLSYSLSHGEYWRFLTPVFLHFGSLHLAFNMLWLLEFGHRIELHHGSLFTALFIMVTGVVSNIAQYQLGGRMALFGGFSGVIYGLMGFLWVREKNQPGLYGEPPGIYRFMLIWLVIGFTGILGVIGFGQMANTAHASGLLTGAACGWLYNHFRGARKMS